MRYQLLILAGAVLHIQTTFADVAPASHSIPVVTRYVKEFSALEQTLLTQSQSANTAAVDRLLAIPFEVVASNGTRITREEWLNKLKANSAGLQIVSNSFSVHESADAAVTSYRLLSQTDKHEQFVVDVWVPEEDHWILQVRYISPVN